MTTYCILALLFSGTAQVQTIERDIVQEKIITASVGENVTFRCLHSKKKAVFVYWHRQKLGDRPYVISSALEYGADCRLHNEFQNDPRFSVQHRSGVTHLTIRHLRPSDSAAYYCGTSDLRVMAYERGSFLHVKGSEAGKRAVIRQGPKQVLLPGNAVNLSCEVHAAELCSEEHTTTSVYWYRPSGSRPSLLYAHDDHDLCNSQRGVGPPPARKSCTFHLPMADLRTEDAGTYYCVLNFCGEILFGNGTAVEIDDHDPMVMYILGAALAVSLILLFILTCMYISRKSCPCCCRGEVTESRGGTAVMETRGPEVDNLLYAAVSATNSRRKGRRGRTETECVYSAVTARH